MEDFLRELKSATSLYFLYGDSGVGKTRLMQELGRNRMPDARIRWVNLSPDDSDDESSEAGSAAIEAIFSSAQSGDIIVADQFEAALKKTRHQLFLSWSTDGVDKQVPLVIASGSEGFNELRQLSQQYQVRVKSFQLMPFSADEVEAFLGFYLFPEHPVDKLSMPAALRKQFAAAQGIVGKIIEIADRESERIKSSTKLDTESVRKGGRIIATVLVLFGLAIAGGWYYLGLQTGEMPTRAVTATETEVVTISEAPVDSEPMVNTEETVAAAPVVIPEAAIELDVEPTSNEVISQPEATEDSESDVDQVSPVESASTEMAEDTFAHEPEPTSANDAPEEEQDGILVISEPGTANDQEAVIVEEAEIVEVTVVDNVIADPNQPGISDEERFKRDLESSRNWLDGNNDSIGTNQILMLSYKTFDVGVYYEYVASLASQQVDTSRLRVFKTLTGKREVYSVFYGEYESRHAARLAQNDLPEVLRKISPIPRSAGGIMAEIQRLEVEN